MPTLDDDERRRCLAAAPVARLATLRADGTPRLVPITFAVVAVDGVELLCFAVDEIKPKAHTRLARLRDIARDARVALLVDHYAADWTTLWWVRVDGRAEIVDHGPVREQALDALAAKYPPYAAARPAGPVVVISPDQVAGWSAS